MDIAQYLEAAKVKEVSNQLKLEGYHIIEHPIEPGTELQYDIVATKGDKKIAIEVKARSHLRESASLIRNLRAHAIQHGYDEFRLIVVNPPRERSIEIAGFEQILYDYMKQGALPGAHELARNASIEDISDIEVDAIEVRDGHINVRGSGVASVALEYGGENADDDLNIDYDFPFTFTTMLNSGMNIEDGQIDIDTSSFFE